MASFHHIPTETFPGIPRVGWSELPTHVFGTYSCVNRIRRRRGSLFSKCLVFTISSAYNLIFSCLTQLELVNMARICHHAQDAVEGYQRAAFDINRYISYYFDALSFRNLQAQTGTLIAGSAACRFIERSPILPSHLELLVYPQYAAEIALWLESVGYRYAPLSGAETGPFLLGILTQHSRHRCGRDTLRRIHKINRLRPHLWRSLYDCTDYYRTPESDRSALER